MIPIPAGCARFLCYGWIITGVIFVLGLNKNGAEHGVRPLLGRLRSLKSLKGAVLGAREWWSGLTP